MIVWSIHYKKDTVPLRNQFVYNWTNWRKGAARGVWKTGEYMVEVRLEQRKSSTKISDTWNDCDWEIWQFGEYWTLVKERQTFRVNKNKRIQDLMPWVLEQAENVLISPMDRLVAGLQ